MQKKLVFLVIALLLYGDIYSRIERCSPNKSIYSIKEIMTGCMVVNAAEVEEDEQTDEDITDTVFEMKDDNQEEDACVYNVSFPTDSRAYLDPENLSGKGQIFSDTFKIENYGSTDIAIKIKNIDIYYRSTEDIYELTESEVVDRTSSVKKLNVDMVWKNEKENTEKVLNIAEGNQDEYVLILKASKYDSTGNFIGLDEGSAGAFYYTGTINANPEICWENDEMTVSFEYEMIKIEEKKEQLQEEKQEREELDKTEIEEQIIQEEQQIDNENKVEQQTDIQEEEEQQTEQGVEEEMQEEKKETTENADKSGEEIKK
ncbi:hypothetical protein AALB51_06015 [Lachnospiraceae bacterium 62-26]